MIFRPKNNALIIMVSAAVIFLAMGFLVLYQRSREKPETNSQANQSQNQTNEQTQETPLPTIAGWKTYTDKDSRYQISYPPDVKAGATAKNSAIGTFQVPVGGIHIGPVVIVVVDTTDLRKKAEDYVNGYYEFAKNPPPSNPNEPAIQCTIESVPNPSASIKSVACAGEGGPARYAFIKGSGFDVFVDGYSKGFDGTDNGNFQTDTDFVNMLSTFKFLKTTSSTPSQNQQTADNSSSSNQTPAPAVQSFTISADDGGASPSEITVAKGTIVDLTFAVASDNVYYGGLEFKSSVINTGTIMAGSSKTVAFTASQSFAFTPYWPSSGVKKDYTVSVIVQ